MENKRSKIHKFKKEVEALKKTIAESKFEEKLEDMKEKEIKILLFDEFLRETNNQKENNQPLTWYFNAKAKK